MFVGKVHSATVVLNIPDLEKVAAKRKRAVRRLEKRLVKLSISFYRFHCIGLTIYHATQSNAYFEATGRRASHVVGRQRCRCFGIETFPIIGFGG